MREQRKTLGTTQVEPKANLNQNKSRTQVEEKKTPSTTQESQDGGRNRRDILDSPTPASFDKWSKLEQVKHKLKQLKGTADKLGLTEQYNELVGTWLTYDNPTNSQSKAQARTTRIDKHTDEDDR